MPRRLLIRPGGIGDCLLCFPAMQELAPVSEVWVPSAVVPLVQFADVRVRSIASTGLDSLGIPCRAPSASTVEALRSFDSIISWYGTNREEFGEACRALGLNIEFRAALPPVNCPAHAVDFFLGRESTLYPELQIPSSSKDFIAIHPFSGSTHKNWALENFRLLEALLPFPAEYCASPEQMLANAVQYASLYDLAAWIRGARLYIGNDSGITHLAAASGVPTVAIFCGHSNPRIWAPRGPHVEVVLEPSVDDVARAVDRLLLRTGHHRD